jgi:hypothetical protein
MPDNHEIDPVLTMLRSIQLEELMDYLSRGRQQRDLATEELERRWIGLMQEWTKDFTGFIHTRRPSPLSKVMFTQAERDLMARYAGGAAADHAETGCGELQQHRRPAVDIEGHGQFAGGAPGVDHWRPDWGGCRPRRRPAGDKDQRKHGRVGAAKVALSAGHQNRRHAAAELEEPGADQRGVGGAGWRSANAFNRNLGSVKGQNSIPKPRSPLHLVQRGTRGA